MLAYNMLLGVIPISLLGLFVAGQVLSSHAIQTSVLVDLRQVFPGSTEATLNSLLHQVQDSTTSTGLLALFASLWLASSFFGALDTSFGRIYGTGSRRWLEQKRFGVVMVGVLLLFMCATVMVPTVQSILKAGRAAAPARPAPRRRRRLRGLAVRQPGAAVRLPRPDLFAGPEHEGALARGLARRARRDARDRASSTSPSRST